MNAYIFFVLLSVSAFNASGFIKPISKNINVGRVFFDIKRSYDLTSTTKQMMNMKRNDTRSELDDMKYNKTKYLNRPGYPQQAHANISYPPMSDDDFDSDFVDLLNKTANGSFPSESEEEKMERTYEICLAYQWEYG